MKIERRPATVLLPVPAVLVTVAGGSQTDDIVTIAWVGTVCSAPPMVSVAIRPSRHSHELLQRSRDFVVNVPRASQVREVALTGLTAAPASKVTAPLIVECPINMECVVRHQLALGAHDLFIGEIVAVHFDEEVVDARGHLKTAAVDALAFLDGDYWSVKEKIGTYGFTKKARKAK